MEILYIIIFGILRLMMFLIIGYTVLVCWREDSKRIKKIFYTTLIIFFSFLGVAAMLKEEKGGTGSFCSR